MTTSQPAMSSFQATLASFPSPPNGDEDLRPPPLCPTRAPPAPPPPPPIPQRHPNHHYNRHSRPPSTTRTRKSWSPQGHRVSLSSSSPAGDSPSSSSINTSDTGTPEHARFTRADFSFDDSPIVPRLKLALPSHSSFRHYSSGASASLRSSRTSQGLSYTSSIYSDEYSDEYSDNNINNRTGSSFDAPRPDSLALPLEDVRAVMSSIRAAEAAAAEAARAEVARAEAIKAKAAAKAAAAKEERRTRVRPFSLRPDNFHGFEVSADRTTIQYWVRADLVLRGIPGREAVPQGHWDDLVRRARELQSEHAVQLLKGLHVAEEPMSWDADSRCFY